MIDRDKSIILALAIVEVRRGRGGGGGRERNMRLRVRARNFEETRREGSAETREPIFARASAFRRKNRRNYLQLKTMNDRK